jgi:peptidoglycan/LPS O-acetylase OafA/YrhL
MKNGKTNWVRGLDSIRFVLALFVFLAHLRNPYHDQLTHSGHFLLRFAGMLWVVLFSGIGSVMAFFIISGFVIHYPNKEGFPETAPFLLRRWLRIGLPLVCMLVIGKLCGQSHAIPVWSLYCELIYYTLYPLLIRIRSGWVSKLIVSFALSLVMIFLFSTGDLSSLFHQRNIGYSGAYWQLGNFLTWIIGLPCWLLGVVLAENIDAIQKTPGRMQIYAWRSAALMTGVGLGVMKFNFYVSYFFTMNFYAILLFFWIRNEILFYRVHAPLRALEFAGKFSYSLFLCHNIFVFLIVMAMPLNGFTYFPIMLLTIGLAYIFYLCVERPSHIWSKKISALIGNVKLSFQKT